MKRPDIKEKISKEAYKCYNRCRGNCSATYKTANEVCLYRLEFIIKIKRPKNLKINSYSKEIEITKYMPKKFIRSINLTTKINYEGFRGYY